MKNKLFIFGIFRIYNKSSYIIQKRAYALGMFLSIIIILLPPVIFLLYYNDEHTQAFELFFSFIVIETSSLISLFLLFKGRYNASANLAVLTMLFTLQVVLLMTLVKYIEMGNIIHLWRIIYFGYLYPVIIVVALMFCKNRWILITSIILVLSTIVPYIIVRYWYNISIDIYTTSVIYSFPTFIVISIISVISRKLTDDAHAKLEDYINNLEVMVHSRTKDLKSALDEKETANMALNEKTIELQKLKEQAEVQARTDVLTGLNNRLAFMEYSQKEVQRTIRYNHPLSLIILDIDHFKSINDTYGHAEGDKVLQGVSKIIVQCLRNNDFPARIGGEEFAIVLPETNLENATIIAERMRNMLEKKVSVGEKPVTCSFGIGFLHEKECSIDTILSRADAALYAAKNNGRNRVEVEAG